MAVGNKSFDAGSGFLYASPAASEFGGGYFYWAVTCKHVIEESAKYTDTLLLRFNTQGGQEMVELTSHIGDDDGDLHWILHPTEDVAVIAIDYSKLNARRVQWMSIHSDKNTFTRESAMEAGLHEGDGVFILGFPEGWIKGRQDYPIVRHGVLAQIRGWFNGDHSTYMIDGTGIEGNSGGPVVTKPERFAIEGTKSNEFSRLIGMVSNVVVQKIEPEIEILPRTDLHTENDQQIKRVVVPYKAGLINVVPVDLIDETIEQAVSAFNEAGRIELK